MEKVMKAAAERQLFLELNSDPERLDLADHYCMMAREMGLKLAISTDAHSTTGLKKIGWGIGQARRGWLTADDVVNTRLVKELIKQIGSSAKHYKIETHMKTYENSYCCGGKSPFFFCSS